LPNNFHITLFHAKLTPAAVNAVYTSLLAAKLKKLSLTFEPMLYNYNDHDIIWNIAKEEDLNALHRLVVETTNPLRGGALQRCLADYDKLSEAQKKQVNEFGVIGVGNDFNPHMTIFFGSSSSPRFDEVTKLLKPLTKNNTFEAQTIAIGELGYHGNLLHILYKIHLQ
jgi:2'-5' RNA ligase